MKLTEVAIWCLVILVAITWASGRVTKKPSNMSKKLIKKPLHVNKRDRVSKKPLNITKRVDMNPIHMSNRVSKKHLNMSDGYRATNMPPNTSSEDTTTEEPFYMYDGGVGLSNKSITAAEYSKWMEEYEYEEPDCTKPGNMCEYVGYQPRNRLFHHIWAGRSTWGDTTINPSEELWKAIKKRFNNYWEDKKDKVKKKYNKVREMFGLRKNKDHERCHPENCTCHSEEEHKKYCSNLSCPCNEQKTNNKTSKEETAWYHRDDIKYLSIELPVPED
uniref:Uncharacterized protein n=1 Tax=Cacopsylla melanoneura TaxID=428564 RepID=A0A8D8S224_9HEMI